MFKKKKKEKEILTKDIIQDADEFTAKDNGRKWDAEMIVRDIVVPLIKDRNEKANDFVNALYDTARELNNYAGRAQNAQWKNEGYL
jgi:hypothetical protein